MLRETTLLLLGFCITFASSCGFPNGTETNLHWWDCGDGSFNIYSVTPLDFDYNYQYPIQLSTGIYLSLDMDNEDRDIPVDEKNVIFDSKVRQYSGWSSCTWTEIPTFGLLSNLVACDEGLSCPVGSGRQVLDIKFDFTKYSAIIALLKNNAPYELELKMTDKTTGKQMCLTVQARATTR